MPSIASYRVLSSFLAVRLGPLKERFVTIPVGAVIETAADLENPGLVTVTLSGESLLAFHRDIMERTEPIDSSLAQGA